MRSPNIFSLGISGTQSVVTATYALKRLRAETAAELDALQTSTLNKAF
jgi:hypothetical protein